MKEAEVREMTLKYFGGDELAADVFFKYVLRDNEGEFLESTPDDMHRNRLAPEFARIESKYPNPVTEEKIYDRIKNFGKIVPQGSPMYGIGNDYKLVSLSNCVVVDSPDDTMTSILEQGKSLANLMKRRCGVGIDISTLRPEGAPVNNAARTSSGAWTFADFFSYVTRMVGQSGRRGALMITMDVRHPDIEKFATMKMDKTKVTGANVSIKITDEFMEAVNKGETFQLRFPVDSEEPIYTKEVNAKELWDLVVKTARDSAEPGLMMWDNITKNLPAHCYPFFKTITTNPCFSGDTLVAVADGRDAVSIKQLAEEGRDVPVYSLNSNTGMVEIKMGRNPRITGHQRKLLRVHLDDGSYIDVTPNHEFVLWDGSRKSAEDLVKGDRLPRFNKLAENISANNNNQYYRVYCNTRNPTKDKVYEHRLIAQFNNPEKWDEIYTKNKKSGWIKGGIVVHHRDYDSLNNFPDNLEIMTFKDHQQFHAEHDNKGVNNGKYCGLTNEDLEQIALAATKKLGRRLSKKEWCSLSSESGISVPKSFSKWRSSNWFKSPVELCKWASEKLGICEEWIESDPRLVRTLLEMEDQNYVARLKNDKVFVERSCEMCGSVFEVPHTKREQAFCGVDCSTKYVATKYSEKQTESVQDYFSATSETKKRKQMQIYSDLKFDLGRKPRMREWQEICKKSNIPYRLGTKYGFENYTELSKSAERFNHKVTSVEELPGSHEVYNITVDDYHTVGIVTNSYQNKAGNNNYCGIYTAQCGEIPLSAGDSCRLISINLYEHVKDKFKEECYFDFEEFRETVRLAQRMADDLVDLEIEKLTKIMEECDTEAERDLFGKLLEAAERGRRTGLGTHGLGDCLAALRLRYDSDEAVEMVGRIYEEFKIAAYSESVNLAKERGAFPDFNWELEKDCEFFDSFPEWLIEEMKMYGRRNISLLTCAPTGSVSIESQVSSGVEPIFRLFYTRRKKINHNENVEPDFIDKLGDKWKEYRVYHKSVKDAMSVLGTEEIPEWFIESDDIDWIKRVAIQSAMQAHIDHSISSTINLPSDVQADEVGRIYFEGWRQGLKGLTVYREGSRDGVLVSDDASDSGFTHRDAAKRPEEIPCDIHHVHVKGEKWVIIVGLVDGKPYEVFGGRAEKIELDKSIDSGILTKKKFATVPNRYSLDTGVVKINDIIKAFDNPDNGTMTRMLSLALRHGTRPNYIVEQIQKDKNESFASFSKVVARVLKTYIEDGQKASIVNRNCETQENCNFVYQEGCATCVQCGWAKCG